MSTTPRLRVLAGPSYSDLTDISGLVNINHPHALRGAHFEGSLVVHIKGFPNAPDSEYFEREERRGVTWSIQVQGRFLSPHSADDILFGNTFDRPLKLPWGSAAALKFMTFIDPALEHDLSGPKPWALSPIISTMPHFSHSRSPHMPTFPPCTSLSVSDDTTELFRCRRADGQCPTSCDDGSSSGGSHSASSLSLSDSGSGRPKGSNPGHSDRLLRLDTAQKRRAYFRDAAHRKRIVFGPDDVLTTDFCYGFLSFPSLALNLPGGVSFDLKKYWDGQPVRFVCVERASSGDAAPGEGMIFWCVIFDAAED